MGGLGTFQVLDKEGGNCEQPADARKISTQGRDLVHWNS